MHRWRSLFFHFGLFISFILLLAGCGQRQEQSSADIDTAAAVKNSLVIELEGVDSVSVFDLLKEEHQVEYKSSLQGVFVMAIDSVNAGDGYFWIYAVNDIPAQTACDRYITKNGDKIKWFFRKR